MVNLLNDKKIAGLCSSLLFYCWTRAVTLQWSISKLHAPSKKAVDKLINVLTNNQLEKVYGWHLVTSQLLLYL